MLCKLFFAVLPFINPSHSLLSESVDEVPLEKIASGDTFHDIEEMLAVAESERIGVTVAESEKMGKRGLIGLSAPQIGINKRIILVDIGFNEETRRYGELRIYINPEIIKTSEEQTTQREIGCLSVDPRIRGVVSRARDITIIAYDRRGNRLQEKFSGFTAHIVQHEIDHLNGIRFPDRVGKDGILHWVEKEELSYYRQTWQNWPKRCSWEEWLMLKFVFIPIDPDTGSI